MLPPCSGQLTAIFVMVGAATLIKSAVGEHRHKTTGQLAAAGLLLVGVVAGSVITTQQLANDEEELEPVAADACTVNASTPQRLNAYETLTCPGENVDELNTFTTEWLESVTG